CRRAPIHRDLGAVEMLEHFLPPYSPLGPGCWEMASGRFALLQLEWSKDQKSVPGAPAGRCMDLLFRATGPRAPKNHHCARQRTEASPGRSLEHDGFDIVPKRIRKMFYQCRCKGEEFARARRVIRQSHSAGLSAFE